MYGIVNASSHEIDALINSWVLNERDRRIAHRRFIDGIRFEKLSEEFDISVTQLKRIVGKCKEAIVSHSW